MMASSPVSNTRYPTSTLSKQKRQQRSSSSRGNGISTKQNSISDLYRRRSSFGMGGSNIFSNLKAVLDSPTTSATTQSTGSPTCSNSSPASFHNDDGHSPSTPNSNVEEMSNVSPSDSVSNYSPTTSHRCENSPNARSISSSESSEHNIDHTALLLGIQDEFRGGEESSDDECEWNPHFSSDELDIQQAGTIVDDDKQIVYDTWSSMDVNLGQDSHHGQQSQKDVENEEDKDDEYCNDGLQLDLGLATLEDMPVTYSHDEFQDEGLNVERLTNQERRNISNKRIIAKLPSGGDYEYDKAQGEEYGKRKNINSFEYKKRVAAMKAQAMKERASSAIVAKAQRAKEKAKGMKKNQNHQLKKKSSQEQKRQGQQLMKRKLSMPFTDDEPNGMEITTPNPDDDDGDEVLSQVSEVSKRFDTSSTHSQSNIKSKKSLSLKPRALLPHSSLPKKFTRSTSKGQQSSSTSISSKYSNSIVSHKGTAVVSAVTSMKDKASSAISQRASSAKAKTLVAIAKSSTAAHPAVYGRTVNLALHVGNSANITSSLNHHSNTTMLKSAHQHNMALPSSSRANLNKNDVDSLFLDEDWFSDCEQSASLHSCSTGSSRLETINPAPPNSNSYATPIMNSRKTKDISRSNTLPRSNVTGSQSYQDMMMMVETQQSYLSPPNSSVLSPVSCIDEDGFLLSPATSLDNVLSDGTGGDMALSTVGSTVCSEEFDPNSFLFLSPLSNHDL